MICIPISRLKKVPKSSTQGAATATIPLRRKNFCPVADRLEKIKAVSRRPSCPAVIDRSLEVLGVGDDVVVIERGDVRRAKPEPDLFMNLSRGLFARYLRTNVQTFENWEQGRAKPNAQAALLIRMVQRFPDTVRRLAEI
jgi:hypothetical protein